MGRLTRFPDLREFRARAARLGQATGPVEAVPDSGRDPAAAASAPWMWIGLAAGAAVLLVWLGWSALPLTGEQAELARRDQLDGIVGEVRASNERMGWLGEDLAALRLRIAAIEQALDPPTGSLGAPAAFERGAAILDSTPPPREIGRPVSLLPDVARLPGRAETPPPPESTGSIAGTASRVLPSLAFAIDLGGFGSVGELKRYWSQLVADNPLLLSGLSPRQVTQVESDGIRSFRLIAGPVEDVAASKRICMALELRGADCRQTIHAGAPI